MERIGKAYKQALSASWCNDEVYLYGKRQLKMASINVLTICILGLLFGCLKEGFLFTFSYIMLRKMSGGYHASTKKSCYLISVILYTCALLCIKEIPDNWYLGLLGILLFLFILPYIPMESPNKPLSEVEKRVYQKMAFGLFCLSFIVAGAFYYFGKTSCYMAVITAVLGTEILLLISCVKNNCFCPMKSEK